MKKIHVLLLLLCSLFYSCNNAEYGVIDNAIYFTDAETSANKVVYLDPQGSSVNLTVRSVNKLAANTSVECYVDPSALDRYNKRNGVSFVILPEELYTLPEKFTISEGEFISGIEKIDIKGFTKEMINSGNKFALPLTIKSVDGIDLLPSSSSLILTIDPIVETSVISLRAKSTPEVEQSGPYIHVPLSQPLQLNTWTIEFRFRKNRMDHTVGQYFLTLSGEGGQEIRFAIGGGHRFWMRNNGAETASNQLMEADKWYHAAIVADGSQISIYLNGVLDKTMPDPAGIQNIQNRFYIGFPNMNSGETFWFSELRIWNTVRSESDIQFNMFGVNPKTEGLVGYWKFNEGSGVEFQNFADETAPNAYLSSEYGENPPVFTGQPEWIDGVRSDDK